MHKVLPVAAAFALTWASVGMSAQAAGDSYQYDAAKGQTLYMNNCAACHQASGEGIPSAFPPLKGNPVVLDANPTTQIKTVLNGRTGKITVLGKDYDGVMQSFKQLKDTEIADIINYERSSWGNNGKHMTAQDVATIRAGGSL